MEDYLAEEEPLEIRIAFEKEGIQHQRSISVTMRTPGQDEDLALGFLFTEGIIKNMEQIKSIAPVEVQQKEAQGNVIAIEINDYREVNFKKMERHFYTTSSCGVCGKSSIEAVFTQSSYAPNELQAAFPAEIIHQLPGKLLEHQSVFDLTGGLHGAALFDAAGRLLLSREDVGRHNALDKLIGAQFQRSMLPLTRHLVLVSGRIGFELVQKSVMAGVSVLAAVGAPSSLAVDLADEAGLTLIGFLRNGRFNIYTHPQQVIFSGTA